VGFVVAIVARGTQYVVLIVEVIVSAGFVAFWIAQSFELWDRGADVAQPAASADSAP